MSLLKNTVYDAGGNNNNHIDPGETVNLTATLKNVGGIDFTNLSTTIQSSDPYITITDNTGNFGILAIDSTTENIADPYGLTASASAPMGHSAAFTLIATDGAFSDTFFFNLIIGTYQYLIWNPDPTPQPGLAADSIINGLGYNGLYATALPLTELNMYQAILVFLGIYPSNHVINATSPEATALVNYINSGGRMYMEGGDCWYYDPLVGGYNFCPLFGIYASADGSTDLGPIMGQTGTFTEGMYFNYSGENSFMDHIDPTGTGFLIFQDVDNIYNCGVANDAGSYQTVGTSFELGALVDAGGVSTRAALLDSILHFFGIHATGIKEDAGLVAGDSRPGLKVYPNMARSNFNIRLSGLAHGAKSIKLKVFDTTGRLVKNLVPTVYSLLPTSVTWNGTDEIGKKVPAGIYFVHLESEEQKLIDKVILVR